MVRFLSILVTMAVICAPVFAGESVHGQAPELKEPTAIADILAHPHNYEGKVVQVTGKVTAVCENMGCWLRVGDDDGAVLLAKSTGDKITIPIDSKGRSVVVEGTVVLEHPDGEAPAEKGHDCESAEVRLETRGVKLL